MNGETSSSRELNESHSHSIGSKDEIGSQRSSELNLSNEVSGLDRTRFVKDEHDIHESVALLGRTIPAGDNGKGIAIKREEICKIHNHARGINGSARESAGGGPNRSHGIATTDSKFTAGLSIQCHLGTGSHKPIAVVDRNGGCPSLSIASTAE